MTEADRESEYNYVISRFLNDEDEDDRLPKDVSQSDDESPVAFMNCTIRGRKRPVFQSLKLPVKAMEKYGVPIPAHPNEPSDFVSIFFYCRKALVFIVMRTGLSRS